MDWQFVSISSVAEATAGGNLTLNAPANAQKGDLLIACIGYRNTPAFTPPVGAGWNLVASQQSSGDTDATSGIASGGMWYLVRGVSNPSFAFTRTGGDVAEGFVLCYRNCTASPYDTGGAATLGSLGEPSLSAISTAEANELLVAMVVSGDQNVVDTFDAATAPSVASGTSADTTTQPTSDTWILRLKMSDNSGADIGVSIADGVKAGTGSTGTLSAVDQTGTTRSVFIVGAFKQLPTVQPNVYDSVTTDSVNQTIEVSEAPLETPSPNVYDSVAVEDELETVADIEDLGPASVFDSVHADEYYSGNASVDPSVYDSITVTESSSAVFDLAYSVYDEITITEDSPVSVNAVEKIIEDFEIFLSTSISLYDEVTVTEFISAQIDAETSIFDTVTVSESVEAGGLLDNVDVADIISVAEDVLIEVSGIITTVSVYDSTVVSENIAGYVRGTNDFDSDSNCVAVWKFETGNLLVDSKGTNDLSLQGNVSTYESDQREGVSCANHVDPGWLQIDDSSLSDGFPLKSGDTAKIFSLCGWFRLDRLASWQSIFTKTNWGWGTNCTHLSADSARLKVGWGYASTNVDKDTGIDVAIDTWYHFGLVIVGTGTPSIYLRVFNGSTGEVSTYSNSPTEGDLNVQTLPIRLGWFADNGGAIFDGRQDEFVVFKDQLTADEIDLIRKGLYTAPPEVNIYDSISVSEQVVGDIGVALATDDSISVSEYSSAYVTTSVSVFDGVTAEDTVDVALSDTGVSVYDEVSIDESISNAIDLSNMSVSDTITLTEDITITSSGLAPSVFDSVTTSENITGIVDIAGINVFDSISVTESVSGLTSAPIISVYDSITVSELVTSALSDLASSAYDEVTIAEDIVSTVDLAGIDVFDTTSIEDIPTVIPEGAIVHLNISGIYDLAGITEQVTLSLSDLARSVYDEISTSELVESSIELTPINVSDSVVISEYTQLLNELASIEVSDIITTSEDITLTVDIAGINLSDTVTVTEGVTSVVDIPGIDVYDNVSLSDIPTVQAGAGVFPVNISDIFETVTVSELVTSSLSDLTRSVYDSVTLVEFVQAAINIAGINVYDTVTLEDSSIVSVSVPSSIQISEVYETVTVSESTTISVPDLYGSTYDTVSISEVIEVAPDVIVSVNDIVTVSEQALTQHTVEMSIFDTSGVLESVSVILDYGVNVSDTVNVRELVSGVGGELSGSVSDTVSVSDWGYIYWLLAVGKLEVKCQGLEINVDTLGFMDRIEVDGFGINIEALGI